MKIGTLRVLVRGFFATLFVLAILQLFAARPAGSAEPAAKPDDKSPEQAPSETAEAPADEGREKLTVPEELELKQKNLESRNRLLEEQERRIHEQEKELDKKIQALERLRSEVNGEFEAQRKNNEEKVAKMVAVFETMTPKATAGVLETLDDWLAVEVLKRMDVKKVAKVMNTMDKTRSAHLSELLTGYYREPAGRKISSNSTKDPKAGQAAAPTTSTGAAEAAKPSQAVPNTTKKGGDR